MQQKRGWFGEFARVRISSDGQEAGGVELYITEKPTEPSIILLFSVNNSAVKRFRKTEHTELL